MAEHGAGVFSPESMVLLETITGSESREDAIKRLARWMGKRGNHGHAISLAEARGAVNAASLPAELAMEETRYRLATGIVDTVVRLIAQGVIPAEAYPDWAAQRANLHKMPVNGTIH